MGPIKIHNGGNYAHAQCFNAYNLCWSQNPAKLIRTFIGQFLKGNSMRPIKIHKQTVLNPYILESDRARIELATPTHV